jgi:hypothetical protein
VRTATGALAAVEQTIREGDELRFAADEGSR